MILPEHIDSIEETVRASVLPRDHDLLVSKLKDPDWKWLLIQLLFEQSIKEQKVIKTIVFSGLDHYETYDSCKKFLDLVASEFKEDPSLAIHSRWPAITRLATRHMVVLRKNVEHPEFKRIMPCTVTLPSTEVVGDIFQMLSNKEHPRYGIEGEISEAFCPRGNWASQRPYVGEGDFFYFCVAILSQEDGFVSEEKKLDVDNEMRLYEEASKMERACWGFDDEEPDASVMLIYRYSQERVLSDRFKLLIRLREENPSWTAKVDGKLVYFWNPDTSSVLFHTDVAFDRAISICQRERCKQLIFTDGTHRTDTFQMEQTLEIMALAKGLGEYEFDMDLNHRAFFDQIRSAQKSYWHD